MFKMVFVVPTFCVANASAHSSEHWGAPSHQSPTPETHPITILWLFWQQSLSRQCCYSKEEISQSKNYLLLINMNLSEGL